MSFFNPTWPQRKKGTGDLDDLEAILSAPPPALGEPLRQKPSRACGQSPTMPAQQHSAAAAAAACSWSSDASIRPAARSPAVAVPPLPLTDAHREGRRISPKSEVRCSITRAVVSPRSSDMAAAIQYRGIPTTATETSTAKPDTAGRQETASSEQGEEGIASFADRVSSFQDKGSSAGSNPITDWLPIRRRAGAASSTGHADAQGSAPACEHHTISLPLLGTYEKMTLAASLVGAVAGGAAAGPLGVSVGAKSGALMVAAGAGICGAAQHCYAHGVSVTSMGSSLAEMGTGLLSSVSRGGSKAADKSSADSAADVGLAESSCPAPAAQTDEAAASEMVEDSAASCAEGVIEAREASSTWRATLSGLGSSLWPVKRLTEPVITESLRQPKAGVASSDSLPTSSSASQQLTPRRSHEGGEA